MDCGEHNNTVVLHAFSNGLCSKCGCEIITGHIPCDKVCSECSSRYFLCQICGEEVLNDGYLPKIGDGVKPLPFISSQKINWFYGIVIGVFNDSPTPECKISTTDGRTIIEYCNYIQPVLTAP